MPDLEKSDSEKSRSFFMVLGIVFQLSIYLRRDEYTDEYNIDRFNPVSVIYGSDILDR